MVKERILSPSTTGGSYNTGSMCVLKKEIICGFNINHSEITSAGMTALRPIAPQFWSVNDFYNIIHSKIHEIR